MEIDIVVPVWNRPVETRSCLVNLIAHSPGARLVLVDNGCDCETERLLHEFAESLDDRALLLSTGGNRGTIKAVNAGLERVQAPLAAIIKSTALVSPGWLEPLLLVAAERPDAGILLPSLVRDGASRPASNKGAPSSIETSHGSLEAMVLRRELLHAAGGLDEGLDGGVWCLKDLSRKAYKAGFVTLAVSTGSIVCKEEALLGSPARRAEIDRQSGMIYAERWGRESSSAIVFPKGTDISVLHGVRDVLLRGARQGAAFTLLVPHRLASELAAAGYGQLHQNIRILALPRFFADGGAARLLAALRREQPDLVLVAGGDGVSFPGCEGALSLTDLDRLIMANER